MPYYGLTGGTGDGGGTNDHRLLAGRQDANQHPASAIAVEAAPSAGIPEAGSLQNILERMAPGADSGERDISAIAAVAIGAYRAVAFRADGRLEPANHDNPAHLGRVAGITAASAAAGESAKARVSGILSFNGWNWSPGRPVYVGAGGGLTQTPPATGFVQQIGVAAGADALLVGLGILIRRNQP